MRYLQNGIVKVLSLVVVVGMNQDLGYVDVLLTIASYLYKKCKLLGTYTVGRKSISLKCIQHENKNKVPYYFDDELV